MKIFSRDLPGLLERERAALAAAEAKARELQEQRSSMLFEVDGFDRLWRLDREIAEQHSRAGIHSERIAALQHEEQELDRARREEQRAAAIRAIEAKLKERAAATAELETIARQLVKQFASVVADRGIRSAWPFNAKSVFLPDDSEIVAHGLLHLLHRTARVSGVNIFGRDFLIPLNRSTVDNLAGHVTKYNERLIASLRTADIEPEPPAAEIDVELDEAAA
jgi:hypothetical protein